MRRRLGLFALIVAGAVLLGVAPASAHVVPSTTIELDVHDASITAQLTLPAADLATASGIDATETIDEETAERIADYIADHFAVRSDAGTWSVDVADVTASETEQWGTGAFPSVVATATLTPPEGSSPRSFTLDYDAIIHQVVTADIFVILHSDWAAGEFESARDLGVISIDTVSGTVQTLSVDLDAGGLWQGFAGMVGLGISHIAEGTDHQLFLLTLLLPAPLLAASGRWRGVVPPRKAARRILGITVAFTLGHSLTLILGTLGLPVPQRPVEALIAVSILIAAVHALRPVFPGREMLVAGSFGLVHGMAFSTTLSALDLSGTQLALSLLGFNLGIEIMQLIVVLLVLPPLVVLARAPIYPPLRVVAALLTAVAAIGWLIDRIGVPNPVGTAADAIGSASIPVVAMLWTAAVTTLIVRRAGRDPAVRSRWLAPEVRTSPRDQDDPAHAS